MTTHTKFSSLWPSLPYHKWHETLDTLHMWTQIVGKVKLTRSPFLNHWWEVAFLITPTGITTGIIPYNNFGFAVTFDFLKHDLMIQKSTGEKKILPLQPQTVAHFYQNFCNALNDLGIKVKINLHPSEFFNPIPFNTDTVHTSYDKTAVQKWWQIQLQSSFILDEFRSTFSGKGSPTQFFWGSFDINTTRFSGKKLPDRKDWPKGYAFMQFAENEENFAVGFWPGDIRFPQPAFYAYLYPAPKDFETIKTKPSSSYFNKDLSEYILPYEKVRLAKNPKKQILNFFETIYKESTTLAGWNREALKNDKPF